MDVTVLHLAEWLMEMQLDRKAGDMLRADLEKQGMKFELQANSKRIIGDEDVEAVELADGRVIETDLVVMAVGIRPYTEVAKDAGLDVQRGIVVNDFLQTSDSNIYAIGECAEHNGKVYGLVAPLYEQGKVLADYLTGNETEGYKGSTTFTFKRFLVVIYTVLVRLLKMMTYTVSRFLIALTIFIKGIFKSRTSCRNSTLWRYR